jgi:hypothetical protein
VLAVGEIQGHGTNAASSWTLTDAGLDYLAQLR